MITHNPFAGVGFGALAWNHFSLAANFPSGLQEEITDNAHNIILQLLAEFGLPGGVFVIGAALFWWISRFREKASVRGWWVLGMVAVISLHSLVEYPLWYAYFLGPFALLVGAGDNAV